MKDYGQKRKLVIGLVLIILALGAAGYGLYAYISHENGSLNSQIRNELKNESNYEEYIFSFKRAYYYDQAGNVSDMDTRYLLEQYDFPVYIDCDLYSESGSSDVCLELVPENANELIRSGFFDAIASGSEFCAFVPRVTDLKLVASVELAGTSYLDFSQGFENICRYADKS